MSTRKIIDIEQNGEKVWPKGHAKVAYMSNGVSIDDSVNSKVSKVSVKQLSTEDFTFVLNTKEGIEAYDYRSGYSRQLEF